MAEAQLRSLPWLQETAQPREVRCQHCSWAHLEPQSGSSWELEAVVSLYRARRGDGVVVLDIREALQQQADALNGMASRFLGQTAFAGSLMEA